MVKIYFYTKDTCKTCNDAYLLLSILQDEYSFEIIVRDIYENDEWLERFQLSIPVVEVNDELLEGNEMDIESLEKLIKKHMKNSH